jgi:hypothetical protein
MYLRLAYWLVGDLPDDWHIKLVWSENTRPLYQVIFVNSDTWRETRIDPRLPFPLPDLGYEVRSDMFHESSTYEETSINFKLSSRENFTTDAMRLISSKASMKNLGNKEQIQVNVGGETGNDQGGPVYFNH